MNSTLNVAYAVSAAFDSIDAARVRADVAPCSPCPRAVRWTPGPDAVGTSRKRPESNQHIFMIQLGAMGAGASGPSPWGCPV